MSATYETGMCLLVGPADLGLTGCSPPACRCAGERPPVQSVAPCTCAQLPFCQLSLSLSNVLKTAPWCPRRPEKCELPSASPATGGQAPWCRVTTHYTLDMRAREQARAHVHAHRRTRAHAHLRLLMSYTHNIMDSYTLTSTHVIVHSVRTPEHTYLRSHAQTRIDTRPRTNIHTNTGTHAHIPKKLT